MPSKTKRFSVVDIETTGGLSKRDRIIEIGIVQMEGAEVVDTYESLIDPGRSIPPFIQRMTGISNDMVATAPPFYQIAREVVERTQDHIFVAHNARFDYGFLRQEFGSLGYSYQRKKLCTVSMSKRLLPDLGKYSLEFLIKHFGLNANRRHRALDDALATAELLQILLKKQYSGQVFHQLVHHGVRESLLPDGWTLEKLHQIPDACGVYYLLGHDGEIVYIGKSNNIKKRIMQHFGDQTNKAERLQHMVADIHYELTGSEIVALLKESEEIKYHKPRVNRAQKKDHFPYVLLADYQGDQLVGLKLVKAYKDRPIQGEQWAAFPGRRNAENFIINAMRDAGLNMSDLKLTGLSRKAEIPHWLYGQEQMFEDNGISKVEKLGRLRDYLKRSFDHDFILIDHGRHPGEQAMILVQDGYIRSYGYVEKDVMDQNLEHCIDSLSPYKGTDETNRILMRELHKSSKKYELLPLDQLNVK